MPTLATPVSALKGIGPVLAKKFAELGIETLRDALYYFPVRHEDFRRRTTIAKVGSGQDVTVLVTIDQLRSRRAWRKKKLSVTEALVSDESGAAMHVVWFNQPYLATSLHPGERVYLSGTVTTKGERLQMQNPAFEKPSADPSHTRLIPVYRSVDGLSQRQIRNVLQHAIELSHLIHDPLPSDIRERYGFPLKPEAIEQVHFPTSPETAARALRRLKFEELLSWQLTWQREHRHYAQHPAPRFPFQEMAVRAFVQSLPFELTTDQRVAAWQILQDLDRTSPMSRLLQGDVGSGKTVVAAIAANNVVMSNGQVAILAPTVILAQQHFATLSRLFAGRQVTIGALTAASTSVNTAQERLSREDFLNAVRDGQIDIVIGTHALLGEEVRFARLGLVIVDEQQRFGVEQRDELLARHRAAETPIPHFLSMTATPIPRTLALALSGELHVTTLQNKPAGVGNVTTDVLGPDGRPAIDDAIAATVRRNEQVFVITPLIEESDRFGARAAQTEAKRLRRQWPEMRIGLVHGSLAAEERVEVLQAYRRHELDVLVSTTVLEIGIDVPNATLMVIEGAEHFGLAQLHQLRGRVGRAQLPGRCILASDNASPNATERLHKVAATQSGFDLAELDLRERGAGEVYGVRQSGLPEWQLATLNDTELLRLAAAVAKELLDSETPIYLEPLIATSPGAIHRE